MKFYFTILTLTITLLSFGQSNIDLDTVRQYFPNGKPYIEYPRLNGKLNGICKEWFENGSIKSIKEYKNDTLSGTQKSFFENGKLHTINIIKKKRTVFEEYYKTGVKKTRIIYRNQNSKSKRFYENGKIQSKEKYRFDKNLKCLIDSNSIFPKCYYKGKLFTDSLKKTVVLKHSYQAKTYFKNGKIESKTIEKKGWRKIKIWNKRGKVIKNEKQHTTQV